MIDIETTISFPINNNTPPLHFALVHGNISRYDIYFQHVGGIIYRPCGNNKCLYQSLLNENRHDQYCNDYTTLLPKSHRLLYDEYTN